MNVRGKEIRSASRDTWKLPQSRLSCAALVRI